jgi:hypothetical protein
MTNSVPPWSTWGTDMSADGMKESNEYDMKERKMANIVILLEL